MNVLFFDTETTGLFNDQLPVDDPSQPYVVQLAAQLCEDSRRVLAEFSLIIDYNVVIPEAASNVHGITNDVAASFGVPDKVALSIFAHLYQRAELIVAHNIEFDKNILETAISRCYLTVRPLRKPLFCTMRAATPIINLSPTERMKAAGFDKPKPPKLEECIRHFFNEALGGAHSAMADVIACRRIYFHLKNIGAA